MIKSSSFLQRTEQWWRAKAGFLISVLSLYLAIQGIAWEKGLPLLAWTVLAILSFGTLGHFINDWSDIEIDRKAGKSHNLAARLSPVFRWMILFFLIGAAALPWFFGLSSNNLVKGLLFTQFGLYCLYSLPPFRLRRIPAVAVFLDSAYAYANPAVLLWLSFSLATGRNTSTIELAVIFLWSLSIGLRNILCHHVADKKNDSISETPNLASQIGEHGALNLIRLFLFTEIILGLIWFSILIQTNYTLGIILLISYSIILFTNRSNRFPFVTSRFGELAVDRFNTTWLGLVALVYLTYSFNGYWLALIAFLLLFTDVSEHPLIKVFFDATRSAVTNIFKVPFQTISLGFNWSLYYFRKWFLRWPEERNWGKHYQKHLEEKRLDEKGNIAIFNQNHNKYSETFISKQLDALDYRTFFYYGWPKPLTEREQGNLISGNEFTRKLNYFWLHLLNKSVPDYEDNRIADSLIKNNVKLIIAHFGPMGVALLDVSRKSGIPMMVVFHGYDAWNQDQLEEYREGYQALFSHASCIVGVSQDICAQLQRLGCAVEKIHHQPAHVDLELFGMRSLNPNGKSFLYMGRFSKTKAPMNVILAFDAVLKRVPDANLVMVGNDDGEGLFETCVMLVKTLKIEDKVQFKGVLSAAEVRAEMSNASVFVQHSVTTPILGDKEGTPVGIMEAMAVGLPIITTRHAGIAELIEDGKTGILVEEYDVEAMAGAMVQLANDSDLRKTLGKNAANTIRENELVSRSLKKFSELIDRHKLR